MKTRRLAIQIVGIVAAIASLGWCVRMALRPENQDQWARLREASAGQISLIVALSAASLIIEGLTFWVLLRPVKRLRVADMLATNALCTFLAYVPFKVSAITRVVIHNRRDGVPLATIMAWFGNFGSLMLATFLPMLALLAVFKTVSPSYIVTTLAASAIVAGLLTGMGTIFKGQRGIERLISVLKAIRLGRLERLLRTQLWAKLHTGFDMYSSAPHTFAAVGLRLLHSVVITWRFVAVAAVFGLVMPLEVALPIAVAFFLIGAASPAGMAGLRESGVTGLAGIMLTAAGTQTSVALEYAPVALVVSATEAATFLVCALAGLAWLRPDRLLKLRASAPGPV